MNCIDLSGTWRYQTDEEASYEFHGECLEQEGFCLPGSTCSNQIGKKQEYYDTISKEAVRAPREKYEYIAPIWLQREIEIPKASEGKSIRLFLERVNIASELWIDDTKIDRQHIELSAPHIYNLTGRVKPGKHRLTLRIDNRDLLQLGTMASGYSIDTQGYWNGIIGRIELQYENLCHIEDIQVYPDSTGIDVKLVLTSNLYSPKDFQEATVDLCVIAPNGKTAATKQCKVRLYHSKDVFFLRYDIDEIQCWDEFHPDLYELQVRYAYEGQQDEKSVRFGMRSIKTEGKKLLLNDKQLSLRGTIDCAITPISGYPLMDVASWRKNLETIKSYGLNHLRFHAWCPPEAAFIAADEVGMYFSIEMPLWLNHDISELEVGDDSIHRQYFMQEAMTISKTYGNHPSFVMFSNGNENMGDFDLLNDIITCIKAYDRRRLYTLTTNFDHLMLPCEDYLCAFEAYGNRIRIQTSHDEVAKSTCVNYDKAVAESPVPIISFEVGQYCIYPNVDLIERYTGNMLPVNLDAIRKFMIEKKVYPRLQDYIKASGDLAVKLYKEDIEAALRTKDFGGFELLSLSDYTGQSTATIGVLDAFWNSKGLIEAKEFAAFAGPVVPLCMAKRIFTNDEVLEAKLALYDYGEEKITEPEYQITLTDGDKVVYQLCTKENSIQIPLQFVTKSVQLTLTVEVSGYQNSWRIFVYAPVSCKKQVTYIRTQEDLVAISKTGGRAVVTKECFTNPIEGRFIPAFWSPVHFISKKPCGAIIDKNHAALANFPTGQYLDYQWKRLIDHSVGMELANFADANIIIETVPNFFDNTVSSPLFEANVGKSNLLFCGFDLEEDSPESLQLRYSIEQYIGSDSNHTQN